MGIIQRQGIKHSIVNFTGLAIGTASTVFVYSQQQVVEAYGLVQYLLGICMVGFPLFSLSGNLVAIRFFPRFNDKTTGHNGFLALLTLMVLSGWTVCALIALGIWQPVQMALHNAPLLQQYLWMAVPLTLFYALATVLSTYALNFKRIVIPSIIFDFSVKVALPLQMIALWLGWISLPAAMWLLLGHYGLIVIALTQYLRSLGEWHWRPRWSFLTPVLRKEIVQYAAFGTATSLAVMLLTKIDTLMVGSMIDIRNTGIYAIALNMAAAIEVPAKGLYGASVSFVSQYLTEEKWTEMRQLYKKVSINLFVAGLLIFGCILVSVNDLYTIMPNSEEVSKGKYVLFFLCLAKLVDMTSGLNNHMVYYSRYYRYSAISLGLLGALNVALNLWLIPHFGMNGAAVATLVSVVGFNLFNLVLVWKKFHMQPFGRNTVRALGPALAALGTVWFLPSLGHPLANIFVRSALYAVVFATLVLRLRISEDVNEAWTAAWKRIRK